MKYIIIYAHVIVIILIIFLFFVNKLRFEPELSKHIIVIAYFVYLYSEFRDYLISKKLRGLKLD